MIDTRLIEKSRRAAEEPLYIQTPAALTAAARNWAKCDVLGIDTEFLRERTYRAKLGLVQLSDGETAWLIDTVALQDFEPLKALLNNQQVLKVFHSSSEDLEVLWNTLTASPSPMIDTQIACAMLGQPLQMSYHHMVKWMMGVEVDKEQTRSNWIRRPLTSAQLRYAASDVVFLPAVARKLQAELASRGRSGWLEEDVETMIRNSRSKVEYDQAYLRINGAGNLDVPSLRVLRALAAWREKTADEKDLARGFVIPDQALLKLASKQPGTTSQFSEIDGIHPKARQRYQEIILSIIESSRSSAEPVQMPLSLNPEQNSRVKKLRQLVNDKAGQLNLDPALLASKKLVESLVHAYDSGQSLPERLTGWRHDVITAKLLTLAADEDRG